MYLSLFLFVSFFKISLDSLDNIGYKVKERKREKTK